MAQINTEQIAKFVALVNDVRVMLVPWEFKKQLLVERSSKNKHETRRIGCGRPRKDFFKK